jgi:hypothetical protein
LSILIFIFFFLFLIPFPNDFSSLLLWVLGIVFFFYWECCLEISSLLWLEFGLVKVVLLRIMLFFFHLFIFLTELFFPVLKIGDNCVLNLPHFSSNFYLWIVLVVYFGKVIWSFPILIAIFQICVLYNLIYNTIKIITVNK